MVSVLFVCLGNICRSPTAEGVFTTLIVKEGLAGSVTIDSAGTGGYHIGDPPDQRAQAAAKKRGIDISDQRAREVRADDFDTFDYVIAMDDQNVRRLQRLCPQERLDRIHLFLNFAPGINATEVPDPYYGEGDGFETVLDMIEAASGGLLADIRSKHAIP